jgi:hypothetical protein
MNSIDFYIRNKSDCIEELKSTTFGITQNGVGGLWVDFSGVFE